MERKPRRAGSGYRLKVVSPLLQLLLIVPCVCASNFTIESGCTCQGHNVTFTCTIDGGGSTIWKGSAFDCPSASDSSHNQILLLHSRFGTDQNPTGSCNNEKIQGMGVSNVNGIFTSQLIVTITPSVIGKEVQCVHENTITEIPIGSDNITTTTENDLTAPGNVTLTDVTPHQLTFSWTAVVHECPAVNYTLTTSSCGDCPSTVDTPTTTCRIQPGEPRTCIASVQAVVCDGILGEPSMASTFRLKVPDAPEILTVIPTYAQNKTLLRISVNIEVQHVSDSFFVSPSRYFVAYSISTSDDKCNSISAILATSCDGVCTDVLDIPSSCNLNADGVVAVFASNPLGNGTRSDEFRIDTMNNFVDIYRNIDRSFTCTFLNPKVGIPTSCFCSIELNERCVQGKESRLIVNGSISESDPNVFKIELNIGRAEYCYVITASNGTYTGTIEGRFSGVVQEVDAGAIIGGVSIVIVLSVVLAIIFLLCFAYIYRRKTKGKHNFVHVKESVELRDLVGDLEPIKDAKRFEIYQVHRNCELSSLLRENELKHVHGCVYYQFTRSKEHIKPNKDIIFQDKRTKELFRSNEARSKFVVSDGFVQRPNYTHHHVFVQSKGIGHRPLFPDTCILYDLQSFQSEETDVGQTELVPVHSERFEKLDVKIDCSLIDLIEVTYKRKYKPNCAFFEFTHDSEDISEDKEVILMNKDEEADLFTGRGAKYMITAPGKNIPKPDLADWRVFVQSKHYGSRHLTCKSLVLYEPPVSDEEEFKEIPLKSSACGRYIELYPVNKDYQLADFLKKEKLNYDDRKVKLFFEFTSAAETFYDSMEVIIMNTDCKIFTGPEVKKTLGLQSSRPDEHTYGRKFCNPHLRRYRIFIPHTGSFTRFLKAGSYLLWEKLQT